MFVKYTAYFKEQVLRKRSYLKEEWIEECLKNPSKVQIQTDGRIRLWKYINDLEKYLRVVTLSDGITVHNAFPDRNFKEDLV